MYCVRTYINTAKHIQAVQVYRVRARNSFCRLVWFSWYDRVLQQSIALVTKALVKNLLFLTPQLRGRRHRWQHVMGSADALRRHQKSPASWRHEPPIQGLLGLPAEQRVAARPARAVQGLPADRHTGIPVWRLVRLLLQSDRRSHGDLMVVWGHTKAADRYHQPTAWERCQEGLEGPGRGSRNFPDVNKEKRARAEPEKRKWRLRWARVTKRYYEGRDFEASNSTVTLTSRALDDLYLVLNMMCVSVTKWKHTTTVNIHHYDAGCCQLTGVTSATIASWDYGQDDESLWQICETIISMQTVVYVCTVFYAQMLSLPCWILVYVRLDTRQRFEEE